MHIASYKLIYMIIIHASLHNYSDTEDTDEDDASTTERFISSLNSHCPHPYKDHVRYSQLFDSELRHFLPAGERLLS